jgi:hypothetical protein
MTLLLQTLSRRIASGWSTKRYSLCASALAAICFLSSGCAVAATPARASVRVLFDYPVVVVESPPARIYDRPSARYHGERAYLVGSRWYYPTEQGWVYFREEPSELRRHRLRLADPPPHRASRDRRHRHRPRERPSERRHRHYDD